MSTAISDFQRRMQNKYAKATNNANTKHKTPTAKPTIDPSKIGTKPCVYFFRCGKCPHAKCNFSHDQAVHDKFFDLKDCPECGENKCKSASKRCANCHQALMEKLHKCGTEGCDNQCLGKFCNECVRVNLHKCENEDCSNQTMGRYCKACNEAYYAQQSKEQREERERRREEREAYLAMPLKFPCRYGDDKSVKCSGRVRKEGQQCDACRDASAKYVIRRQPASSNQSWADQCEASEHDWN